MSAPAPIRTITLGDEQVRLERPSGRKAARALALLRALSKAAPSIQTRWADFTRDYEAANYVELDRAQARMRFPRQPILDDDGAPVYEPTALPNGDANPRAGELLLAPSRIDALTDEDWARADHKLRLARSPSAGEQIAAVLDEALEVAEGHVYKLLALFTIPNRDVKTMWREGAFAERLQERADDLLDDSYADELLELAVAIGELVDDQFRRKVAELGGGRVGKALLRFAGIDSEETTTTTPTSTMEVAESPTSSSSDGPSASTPPSSTDTPAPTPDGDPTPSSTPRGTSSSSSEPSPEQTSLPSSTPEPPPARESSPA